MDMSSCIAVITGGASGLGEACGRELVTQGARVLLLDRDADRGPTLADELGDSAGFATADVTAEADIIAALDRCEAQFGVANVAINCAGIAVAAKTIGRDGAHPLDLYKKVIDINLVGSFNVARLAAERMQTRDPNEDGERGVIINTASIAAFDGQKGQPAYAASKAGVAGLSLPMARDMAAQGIRVNAIAPGLFQTPMISTLPEDAQVALANTPLFPKRLGHPQEFARLAAFIITCPYLNAETIRLDGGTRLP